METACRASIVPPDGGELLNVVGDSIRLLTDSDETGGRYVVFECITQPGGGPPLHRHRRDDEMFFVAEGTVKFVMDGQESVVGPGSFVLAPRGSVHAFCNVGPTPSRMIITCSPGGLEGPFRAVDRLHRDGLATPERIGEAFLAFDLDVVGPPLGVGSN